LLLTEAVWLGLLSSALGLMLGQAFVLGLAWAMGLESTLLSMGMLWPASLALVPALALTVSVAAALLPAWGAYRSDVLELLQSRG
jgi:putative ABC transport system permease protein